MSGNGKENFLGRLRAADEKTKRKIAVIAACACMVIIVYVWIVYFNNLVAGAVKPASTDVQSAPAAQATPSGFWDGVKGNASVFYQKLSGAFGSVFQLSKQYNVQPQN